MIDEEKLREAVEKIKGWYGSGNYPSTETFSAIYMLIDLAEQVLSAEWPEKKEHHPWCDLNLNNSPKCSCKADIWNEALDPCRLAAAKDRLKRVSVYDLLNIIEQESKLDMDFHGLTAQAIATAIHAKICGES